jgi:S-methylmethionine-dependent homocysteine/selenocysteine methylase
MTSQEAEDYHSKQIATIAMKTEADLISAFTINYPEEAVGIVRACKKFDIPVVISFTVETNGKLPNGQSLKVRSVCMGVCRLFFREGQNFPG